MSNRTVIKSHFRTGDIPTQDNFYDLIDSVLNQDEDGITKKAGNPISLQAEGDVTGVQNVLFLYRKLTDESPGWKISLNPRSDPQAAATNKPGLNISDGPSGASRLFIRGSDGNVGLGTIEPAANLHIRGAGSSQVLMGDWKGGANYAGISLNGTLDASNYNVLSAPTDKSLYLNRPPGSDIRFRMANNDQMALSTAGHLGIGTEAPLARLQVVGGAIMPAPGNADTAGIQFPNDPFGGAGDNAWIRYYARAGEACTLEIGIANDGDDHIALMPSGNVGIGTVAPAYKLHVAGSLSFGGFTVNDADEWPNVVWCRDTARAWDEGLIKGNSSKGVYNRAGFGIHMHESKHFCFYSTNWNPLMDLEGGSGNLYVRGNVGIGTATPKAKLHVNGAVFAGTSDIYFTDTNHGHTGIGNSQGYAAIENGVGYNALMILGRMMGNRRKVNVYDDLVVAGLITPNSDGRIKKDIAASNAARDITILNKLKVRDYLYKAAPPGEAMLQKGFVAQEVEEVFPDAVVKHADFVPDVFAQATSVTKNGEELTVTMAADHGLETGDLVRLITSAGTKEVTVARINGTEFSVSNWTGETDSVFVYGKMVQDFRSLNYNAIFSLGISAMQELYRQVQQLKADLSWAKEKLVQYSL